MGYPNVAYNSVAAIVRMVDGVAVGIPIAVPFSSCSVTTKSDYNLYPPLQGIGPVEYSAGPITVTGSITIPIFHGGPASIMQLKELFLSPDVYMINVFYGWDEPQIIGVGWWLTYRDAPYPRTETYSNCAIQRVVVECQPSGHVTCVIDFIGVATTSVFDAPAVYDNAIMEYPLVPFHRTGLWSNKDPYIAHDNVSGWKIEIKRDWKHYWAWGNTRYVSALRPGTPSIDGSFTLLNAQRADLGWGGIPNGGGLFFDVGIWGPPIWNNTGNRADGYAQYGGDPRIDSYGLPGNYLEFPKVLIEDAPTPINAPNRITQTVNFIAVNIGTGLEYDGTVYTYDGVTSYFNGLMN